MTRPTALAAEHRWRADAERAPRFTCAVPPARRLTLMQDALELATITVATLVAQDVKVLGVQVPHDGVPQIHVASADGERAYGDLAHPVPNPDHGTRYVLITGCLVYWHCRSPVRRVAL